MTKEIDKSEEQIAKDKEAVARMIGAKSAMEAAQRRIETLEFTLKNVRSRVEHVGKAFGGEAFIRVFIGGDWKTLPARDVFAEIDATIGKVL